MEGLQRIWGLRYGRVLDRIWGVALDFEFWMGVAKDFGWLRRMYVELWKGFRRISIHGMFLERIRGVTEDLRLRKGYGGFRDEAELKMGYGIYLIGF